MPPCCPGPCGRLPCSPTQSRGPGLATEPSVPLDRPLRLLSGRPALRHHGHRNATRLCRSIRSMLLIVGPGLAAAFHRARLPTLTLRDCPALSVSYLQAFHLLLARDEAIAALLCPSPLTDVPSPPSGPSWDLTILLTLVAVIVRASACAGFTLRGPPWQLEGRNAVALVWNDHLDTLPPDFPRLRVLPPPPVRPRPPQPPLSAPRGSSPHLGWLRRLGPPILVRSCPPCPMTRPPPD